MLPFSAAKVSAVHPATVRAFTWAPRLSKQGDGVDIVRLRGHHQGGLAEVVGRVDLRALVQKRLDRLGVAHHGGEPQVFTQVIGLGDRAAPAKEQGGEQGDSGRWSSWRQLDGFP